MIMKIRYILFSAFFLFCSTIISAQGLLGFDGEESTGVGVYICDIRPGIPENERVLVDHNSALALTPASVMKALTTATALDILGQDFRFSTPVELRGSRAGARWTGDLVIRSCGDPTIDSENIKGSGALCQEILAGLKKTGITRIDGRIVVEQTLSDAGPIAQWEIEDVAWPYGAGLFGLNYKDNTFTLWPATGQTKPYVPDLKIDLIKSSRNDLLRGVESNRLIVWGTRPDNRKWTVQTTMPDPAAVLRAELMETLRKGGVELTDRKIQQAGSSVLKVCTHRSAPAVEIMRSLMVRSDNLFAEGMLRAIAPGATRAKAIEAEKKLWADRGLNPRYTIINDGSGLTRANRLSARFLGQVLKWMAASPKGATYTGFFPRAGMDGTMRNFLKDSPLKGRLALKTGSVSSVQCYAGYLFDADPQEGGVATHVAVVLVNGFFCKRAQVRDAIERLFLDTFVKPIADDEEPEDELEDSTSPDALPSDSLQIARL